MAAEGNSIASDALLDLLFVQDDVGVAVWGPDLRFARVNHALAAMNGASSDDHLGRTTDEVLPGLGRELVEEVLRSGNAAVGVELTADGERHLSASYYPLLDRDGETVGVSALVTDITRRKRAEAELERRDRDEAFHLRVSGMLASSRDAKRMLRGFARLAVPRLADWCVIDMVQADGSLRRVALAHADRSKEDLGWEITRRYPSAPNAFEGIPKAIRSSFRELVPEIRDSFLEQIARDERHLELLLELGLRSLMIVPLTVRGCTLGAVTLAAAQSGRRYDRHDLAFAQALADRCALAVDNAQASAQRGEAPEALARSL